ncbi:hypothetical protein ANCDUO_01745 [Ancylostoma duodenale]|uniref:Endonuclease/exonuclease/phosphatase domain-containing protein n=1 Tax=Ancylostoma duodenale TaxID=51022 RepID=A0A0C2HEF6_9BILA|nr:hypothetical protein ANCDUO_01745 [Ancylostoma duodenale]
MSCFVVDRDHEYPVCTLYDTIFGPSMASQSGRVLLITANVGSLFEQDRRLQEAWLKTFTERINEEMADIVVIHMQETGGKQLAKTNHGEISRFPASLFSIEGPNSAVV